MKFKVLKLIGKGGFGNVDLVEDEYGKQFARKSFSQNQPLTPELLENVKRRFAKEVRIQGSINHRNIVPIVDSDVEKDPPFYITRQSSEPMARSMRRFSRPKPEMSRFPLVVKTRSDLWNLGTDCRISIAKGANGTAC